MRVSLATLSLLNNEGDLQAYEACKWLCQHHGFHTPAVFFYACGGFYREYVAPGGQ